MSDHSSPAAPSSTSDGEATTRRSVPRRLLEWLAGVNMWLVMATGFLLGYLADQTVLLDSVSVGFYLAGGLLPIVLQTVTTSKDGYQYDISNGERARFVASMLRWSVTPWGILTQVVQIVGNFLPYARYRGNLPNRDRHRPETDLTLPFDGEWTVVNGGVTKATSHSWGLVSQRYAYDFVVTDDEGETHDGDGDELTDYYAFGEPIRAPADGIVVSVTDELRDYPNPGNGWTEWRTWQIAGNTVVVEHDTGEYSTFGHLQQDSVSVEPGDHVSKGDPIGRCGNSGNSSEPHLHYQLQDRANFWTAAGLVPRFSGVAVDRDDDRRATHDVYERPEETDGQYLWAGDRVRADVGSSG